MQYTITPPSQFKKIPWKNGKGSTIELAINKGATLDNFDWRISMADVVENGPFSDFSGYLRHLILIKGHSITLEHEEKEPDFLTQHLNYAKFLGSNKTTGILPAGPITDFNIMTKTSLYDVDVFTAEHATIKQLTNCNFAFIYSLSGDVKVSSSSQVEFTLPAEHLLQVWDLDDATQLTILGGNLIVVSLKTQTES